MIVDQIEFLAKYRALSPQAWDKIIAFLPKANTITEKHREELDGDKLFALVQFYDSKNPAEMKMETHRVYADIHILLVGGESLYYQKPSLCKIETPYKEDGDAEMSTTDIHQATEIKAPVGTFAIFFPNEPHAPCIGAPQHAVKKIVVKIHRDLLPK